MKGTYTAYYLSQDEYKRARELNVKVEPSHTPYLLVGILEYFGENVFEGVICKGVPYSRSKLLKTHDIGTFSVINDFDQNQAGVFTFDGRSFFKIASYATTANNEGLIYFRFKFIEASSFLDKNTAFMIMPFGYPELNQFYHQNVKSYLKSSDLGIDVRRSDDFTGADVVADTIIEQIRRCEFVICDITNCNKNVFFEIGFAKGINKDIIFLLEQNRPAEFFDVNHIRRIEYSYDRPPEFQALLRDTLISIRNNRP